MNRTKTQTTVDHFPQHSGAIKPIKHTTPIRHYPTFWTLFCLSNFCQKTVLNTFSTMLLTEEQWFLGPRA